MHTHLKKELRLLLILLILGGLVAVLTQQFMQWDSLNYHFYNAYAFLDHRFNWDIAPAQIQTYFNPELDTFNYLIINTLHYPFLFEFFFGALTGGLATYILIKIAKIFFNDKENSLNQLYIILATLIGISTPSFTSQIGVNFTDAETNVLILVALYYILKSISTNTLKQATPFLLISGLSAGLAVGTKLTTAIYIIGFLISLCCYHEQKKIKKLYLLGLFALTTLTIFLVTEGYWMWQLYKNFQSPLFPSFNNFFHSPYALNQPYNDSRFIPKNLNQWLFNPFFWITKNTLVSEVNFRDWRLATLILLIFLSLGKYLTTHMPAFNKKNWPLFSFLFIFLITSYITWLKVFAIYRYLISVCILSGIAIISLSAYLLSSYSIKTKRTILITLTIILIMTTTTGRWGRFHNTPKVIIPSIEAQAYVIMITNTSAQGYLVAYFPKETRFISVYNNFMTPETNIKLLQIAVNLITHYKGPLYVIDYPNSSVQQTLHYYHLKEIQNSCQKIYSSFNPNTFELCEVRHK